ncbi:hypothetical protein C8R45DRAFT_201937 [Mycena sanguinolenta]|nr:hypothetical protein C8R45DRAFT_201937 [Mycena sanguinolenta]
MHFVAGVLSVGGACSVVGVCSVSSCQFPGSDRRCGWYKDSVYFLSNTEFYRLFDMNAELLASTKSNSPDLTSKQTDRAASPDLHHCNDFASRNRVASPCVHRQLRVCSDRWQREAICALV